jgi:hypothetical protein
MFCRKTEADLSHMTVDGRTACAPLQMNVLVCTDTALNRLLNRPGLLLGRKTSAYRIAFHRTPFMSGVNTR